MFLFNLAEEEWIEEQLAINPDFDPNDEANAAASGVDDQQPSSVANDSTAQNATSDHIEQTGEGTLVEGENKTPEARPKPKRYVIFQINLTSQNFIHDFSSLA